MTRPLPRIRDWYLHGDTPAVRTATPYPAGLDADFDDLDRILDDDDAIEALFGRLPARPAETVVPAPPTRWRRP